jgi:ABC-type branched-subunit amino acid transport system substrate-binding protein
MKTILVCLLALALFAQHSAAQSRKFRIGVSCPLSGILAEYGTAVRNGIELLRETNPAAFKHIELLYQDSKWDPKTAVEVFHNLHAIQKVDIIYNWGNPTSDAVAPIAERKAVSIIAMSSNHRIAAGRSYIVRSINAAEELGKLLAAHLLARGFKSTGVLLVENTYVQGLYDGMAQEFSKHGTAQAIGPFSLDQQTFGSLLPRIKSSHFDALGVFLVSGQLSSFYRELAVQHFKIPTFSADFLDSENEIRSAGPLVEGAVFPTFDVTDTFREQYLKTFGNDVQIPFAANAHDVVLLLSELFGKEAAEPPPPAEIMAKIKTVRNFKGANGQFSVISDDAYGPSFRYPLIIKKVTQGRPLRVP